VAFVERVIVLVPIPAMVVEAMPVPEMGCPTSNPVTLDTPVMVELPVTTMPVGVAFAAAVIAVTTEPCGIPIPVMMSPGTAFVEVSTLNILGLPDVVTTWNELWYSVP